MKHQLVPLPFSRHALEPHISAETIDIHYGKHHQKYVDELNKLIEGTFYEKLKLEEIIHMAPAGAIFNNASQIWNHDFYWKSLTPNARPPGGALSRAIEKRFGTFNALKREITEVAAGHFGSGWAWLLQDANGALAVETTSNAGTPLGLGKTPLLAIDVWEHAYYIDYRNERPRHLEQLENILNWEFAEHNFEAKRSVA